MENGQEEDPDVSAAAEREALSGYGLAAPPPPQMQSMGALSDSEVLRMMGKNPLEMLAGNWESTASSFRAQHAQSQAQMASANASAYKSYLAASEKAQIAQAKALEKQNDPFFRAQNIYGKTGNLAAARTIAKTAGPALFQLGEQVDLGPNQMFAIRPVGDLDIPNPDGTSSKVPAWQFLHANGVNVVPYLGGDEEAKAFRSMAGKTGELMNTLDQIEKLYANSDLKSMRGTETYRQLVQLEAGLSTIVQSIKTGSKSMAGVSDNEMNAIQASLPQSGTKLLESTGSGLINVRNTRAQVLGILTRTARMNGVELVQLKPKDAPNSRRVTTPGSAPPGTKNPSNGKQSGSSTSGQPR
jgi:hypothetical protein